MQISVVRVLVVDDFPLWRTFVQTQLEDASKWQIIGTATDGLEAIEKAADLHPDLVLMDINLPRLNGIEAAQEIIKFAPQIKILFLSSDSDLEVAKTAINAGGHGYLHKSEAGRCLIQAMETVLLGDQYARWGDQLR